MVLSWIAGCASGGASEDVVPATVDTTAPFVVATSPAELTDDVPLDSIVSVAFSEAMDPSTLTTDSFSVSTNGISVSGTVSYADSVATFTPATILGGGATYTAKVTTAVRDAAGNTLPAEYEWGFSAPAPQVAYVANKNDASISIYWIDAATGLLHPRGQVEVFLGTSPIAVSEIASNRLLVVANFDSNNVTTFQIEERFDPAEAPAQTLKPIGATGGVSQPQSIGVAATPSGKFVYVANSRTDNVRTFRVNDATGTLDDLGVAATGKTPVSLAVDPVGSYLYVANFGSSNVTTFHIDPDTGALELRGPVPVGVAPRSVAVYSTRGNGQVVYVANRGSQDTSLPDSHEVVMFPVNPATGVPIASQKQRKAFSSGNSRPESITVDPTGRFLYVADPGRRSVAVFAIDPETGALGDETTIAIGTQPVAVKVDPTGQFAYVVDFGDEAAQPSLPGNLMGFRIDQLTGALTPNGATVATGNQPYGMTIIAL